MSRILIAEDNLDKRSKVVAAIKESFPSIQIDEALSFKSALKQIVMNNNQYSVMILDMTMPNYDFSSNEPSGGGPESYAGKELLSQMKLRKILIPTIVLTMFDSFDDSSTKLTLSDLKDELKKDFSPMYLTTIYYNTAQDTWKKELIKILRSYCNE